MPLKAIVTAQELGSLPDPIKAEYVDAGGGSFRLNVAPVGGYALEEVTGLRTALGSERARADKAEAAVKAFEGLDPAAARDALKKVGEIANWKPDDKVREQMEAQAKQLGDKHAREIEAATGKAKAYRGQVERLTITNRAMDALAKHAKSPQLMLPHVLSQVRAVEDEAGIIRPIVVDEKGNPRITMKPGSQDGMTIEELVETMKADPVFAPAFNPTQAGGSGSGPSVPPTSGVTTVRRSDAAAMSRNIEGIAAGKVVVID